MKVMSLNHVMASFDIVRTNVLSNVVGNCEKST